MSRGEHRSVCVGASAGSGKTTRLVGEYFEHIEDGVGIQSILALTFNDEAAANMRKKIRDKTLEIMDEGLFDQLNWAQVQTFHSFCSQVLREFHLQSNVPSDFTVIEEMDLQVLLNDAWEDLITDPDPRFRRTFVKISSVSTSWKLRNIISFLYERRARAVEALQAMSDRETFKSAFHEMVEGHLGDLLGYFDEIAFTAAMGELLRLAEKYAEEGGDTAANYLFQTRSLLLRAREGDRYDRLLAFQGLLDIKGNRKMGNAKKMGGEKERLVGAYGKFRDHLEGAEEELNDLQFDLDPRSIDLAVEHLMGLREIFLRFVSLMDGRKAERRCLDFNDLLIKAQEMLDPSVPDNKVLRSLQQRYRYILVDEYQDTDLPQDRIVRALLGDDQDKLFVVGDGKQSIYLFRGADVTIFKGMLRYVEFELKGQREELGNNYRSARELVSFVNTLFSRTMVTEERDWEFRYQEVQPYRLDDEGSVTIVQVVKGGPDDRLSMARAVAEQIEKLVNGDGKLVHWNGNCHLDKPRRPKYGDITILLRARTNLRYYEGVLAEREIPYAVEKGVGFFQRQEIMDVGNALSFLGNQMDDISLYGLLRSPYFSISDETLFQVVRSLPFGQLFTKLKRFTEEHPEEMKARKAAAVLGGLLKRSRTVPVSELLNDLMQETGVLGVYAGLLNGKQMIANVEQLLGKVRQREQEGFFTLYDLIEWLGLSVDDSDKEGQAQLEATGDAVRIMTVHASKGLEFPIVILPETDVTPRSDADPVAMTSLGLFSEVPSIDPMVTYQPAPLRCAKDELRAKSEAQNLRLFYVAATRAKDHFIMLGARGRKEREWDEIGPDRRDWLALTMTGMDIGPEDIDNGGIDLKGKLKFHLGMESFDDRDMETIGQTPVPYSVMDELSCWEPELSGTMVAKVKLVVPSATDRKVEGEVRGGVRSETKRLLMSKGLDAAMYGTLVHEVLRGKSPRTLLDMYHLNLSPEEFQKAVMGLDSMYTQFMSTDLMKEKEERGKDLQEMPFELKEGDTLYKGVIDRLVQLKGGRWALIDYKSMDFDQNLLNEYMDLFRHQVSIYHRSVMEIIGHEIDVYIYFIESGKIEKVKSDDRTKPMRVDP